MHKNRIKIKFFQDELYYQMELQQKIEQISQTLKQALKLNSSVNQSMLLRDANIKIREQIKTVSNQIIQIKRQSDLIHDAAKIQGQAILKSMEQKVDDLNERLYNAENCLQYAESIKKQQDSINSQYQMSNVKHFKKQHQAYVISKYIQAKHRVIREFQRSIQLTLKIYSKDKTKLQETKSQLQQLLIRKNNKVSYAELRNNQIDIKTNRLSKSNEKVIISQPLSLNKRHRTPFIALLLQSPAIPFKHLRSKAGISLITKLKLQNRQQTLANQKLSQSLEMRNRNDVLKYLESKSELSQEEAIMKLELMGAKMNNRFQQRMVEIKPARRCKEENFELTAKKNRKQISRLIKSLDKIKPSNSQIGQIQSIYKKMTMPEKQFSSNPKTNDSLSGGRHVI